jgi:hypothetical protein
MDVATEHALVVSLETEWAALMGITMVPPMAVAMAAEVGAPSAPGRVHASGLRREADSATEWAEEKAPWKVRTKD